MDSMIFNELDVYVIPNISKLIISYVILPDGLIKPLLNCLLRDMCSDMIVSDTKTLRDLCELARSKIFAQYICKYDYMSGKLAWDYKKKYIDMCEYHFGIGENYRCNLCKAETYIYKKIFAIITNGDVNWYNCYKGYRGTRKIANIFTFVYLTEIYNTRLIKCLPFRWTKKFIHHRNKRKSLKVIRGGPSVNMITFLLPPSWRDETL